MRIALICPTMLAGALGLLAAQAPPASAPAPGATANVTLTVAPPSGAELPREWIDPVTGHRIVRLSQAPNSLNLYFHQNAYTPEGDKLLIATPGQGPLMNLSTVNLRTRQLEVVVTGVRYNPSSSNGIEMAHTTREVYYSKMVNQQPVIYATNVDTKATREIARLPFNATFGGLNADDTLLVGAFNLPNPAPPPGDATAGPPNPPVNPSLTESITINDGLKTLLARADPSLADVFARYPNYQPLPAPPPRDRPHGSPRPPAAPRNMELFTVNTKTGAIQTFLPSTDWLNHVQCSPTDPGLVLFCHEGNWDQVDRIWTIRTDGSNVKLMHQRATPEEIAGHEFFGADGRTIWYDLQTPRSTQFWLAGVNLDTGQRTRYPLERAQWSVHYNQSHDGKLFCGDGGGPDSVANRTAADSPLNPPGNGQWLYLFTPQPDSGATLQVGDDTIQIGRLAAEKLVDLSKHNYVIEPNAAFTPDDQWLVFRSNLQGPLQVYMVEIAKARPEAESPAPAASLTQPQSPPNP